MRNHNLTNNSANNTSSVLPPASSNDMNEKNVKKNQTADTGNAFEDTCYNSSVASDEAACSETPSVEDDSVGENMYGSEHKGGDDDGYDRDETVCHPVLRRHSSCSSTNSVFPMGKLKSGANQASKVLNSTFDFMRKKSTSGWHLATEKVGQGLDKSGVSAKFETSGAKAAMVRTGEMASTGWEKNKNRRPIGVQFRLCSTCEIKCRVCSP